MSPHTLMERELTLVLWALPFSRSFIKYISYRREMKESQKCVHAGLCAECGYRGYCIFGVICNKLQRDVLPHRPDCDLLIQIPHFPPHVSPRVPTCPANISTSYRCLSHNEIMAGIGIHHQLASNTIQSPVRGNLSVLKNIYFGLCMLEWCCDQWERGESYKS